MSGAPESDNLVDVKITPEMIEAGARCLRAYMEEEAPSYRESLFLIERVLQAAFSGSTPPANAPSKLL
jgi:hypothetical protein